MPVTYPIHSTVYSGQNLSASSIVKRYDQPIIEFIKNAHDYASANIPLFEERQPLTETDETLLQKENQKIQQLKKENAAYFLSTAFGKLDAPQFPEFAPRGERKNGGILRDYIALDYDLTSIEEANRLRQNVYQLFVEQTPCRFALYPSIRYPRLPRFRLVIEIDQLLDKKAYKQASEALLKLIDVESNDFVSNTSITHPFNLPFYVFDEAPRDAVFVLDADTFPLNQLITLKPSKEKQKEKIQKSNTYRTADLHQAIEALLNDQQRMNQLDDYDYFWRFAESLAESVRLERIDESFAKQILTEVAQGNPEWEANNLKIYEAQLNKLIMNPDKRGLVKPLAHYLPLVEEVQKRNPAKNLTQLFVQMLPSDFEGDTDIEVKTAADLINQFFEFALLPGFDSDSDALAIFNPLNGLWTHNENDFISLLSIVKPAITPIQVKTAIMYWAATANHQDNYLKPYSGTQYLVFKNGVLDILSMTLHSLSSELVKQKQFTTRHQLQIDYNPNPILKEFEHDTLDGSSWNINKFIDAYAANDPQIRQYFLFGLSLGLFAGHNTGVHFDIQGESGSGKSTLATIYRGLFSPQRVVEILFSDLNKDFPLSGFHPDTAVIWIKECNTGVTPLDDDHGTPFYDGLADGMVRLPVKHGADQIIQDPPQVYIDGTQLIQSSDIRTGPARRTLAFKLPNPIEPFRHQFYSNQIQARLLDPEVLQYLVMEMIRAFKEIVPESRQPYFKMNLGLKTDLALLPKQALHWRQEFVSADSNIREWFEEEIKPSLQINNPEGWLTDEFFYKMYLAWYRRRNQQDLNAKYAKRLTNFIPILQQLFEEDGYYQIEFRDSTMRNRKKISNPDSWGFTWKPYDEMFIRPIEMTSPNAWQEVYQKKVSKLYRLVDKIPNPKYYKESKHAGVYIPLIPSAQIPDA